MEQKKKPGRPAGTKNKGKSTKNTSSKSKAKTKVDSSQAHNTRLKDEIWAIIIIAIGAFLFVALQTDAAGQLGVGISVLLKGFFGVIAVMLPYYLIAYGILLFSKRLAHMNRRSVAFVCLIFFLITLMNSARYLGPDSGYTFSPDFIKEMFLLGAEQKGGGVLGMSAGYLLIKTIGMTGLYLFSGVGILVSLLLVVNTPVSQFLDAFKEKQAQRRKERALYEEEEDDEDEEEEEYILPEEPKVKEKKKKRQTESFPEKKLVSTVEPSMFPDLPELPPSVAEPIELPEFLELHFNEQETGGELDVDFSENQLKILDYMKDEELFEKSTAKGGLGLEETVMKEAGKGLGGEEKKQQIAPEKKQEKAKAEDLTLKPVEINVGASSVPLKKYELPPIDLLNMGPSQNTAGEKASLKSKAAKLEQTLQDFNVNARVIQVTRGPAVTRYEIQPSTGVKVSSIVRLSDDIALNLEAKSIRIEAPIPGKAAVGIEVENERINLVALREIVASGEFKSAESKLTFVVGKDIAGKSIVADLKSMPHLLIAGSTGSGKSVCINSIIISLLYKARPDEVKFVLVDPKVVELGNYNDIPHLLIPVVTDPSKAAAALNWAVVEMTDRYKKFAEAGVRDLQSFNDTMRERGETANVLPQIVIIIDELADLMMAAPSQVEESICRLAQMARAAGMHLIVATQRPSVDVITGVIKANIPSRIAFAVSSQVDSRTILDMAGAEKLVGKGDMLFNPLGMPKPIRVQGTFISDAEVHKVLDFVKGQSPKTEYADDVIHTIEKVQTAPGEENMDELLPDAIETIVVAKQASVSMLQRRFRIGYNRAARLIDMIEARGIIGPADGSRPRTVLMTEEEYRGLSADDQGEQLQNLNE